MATLKMVMVSKKARASHSKNNARYQCASNTNLRITYLWDIDHDDMMLGRQRA